jgi:outer membrane protein OmpA-like peptidoglycan-associated protein
MAKCVLDPARDITFYLTKCDYAASTLVNGKLLEMAKVRRARLVTFDKGLAQIDVQYLGTPQDLANELQALGDPQIVIEGLTANTIRVHLK